MAESNEHRGENPYDVVDASSTQGDRPADLLHAPLNVGLAAVLGTGCAGGLYGYGIWGIFGLLIGTMLAIAGGLPVALLIYGPLAIFCRDGISRGASILSSIICGAVSGFLVSYLMFKNDGYAFAAAFVGALVAPLVVLLATRNPANTNSTPAPTLAEWSDLE